MIGIYECGDVGMGRCEVEVNYFVLLWFLSCDVICQRTLCNCTENVNNNNNERTSCYRAQNFL